MPELPEVQTVVSELNTKLKNRKLKSVKVNAPKMIAVGPGVVSNRRQGKSSQVIKFVKLLQGQKVLSVKRRAKLLIFDLSGPLSMLVHLKMTGQFIFEDKALRAKTLGKYRLLNKVNAPLVQLPGKHTHVIFEFTDGSRLYFNDMRRFGYLKIVRDDEFNQVKELNEYGPEPLGSKFTYDTFLTAIKNWSSKKISIKMLLMDPRFVAGIGNIYSDEILFLSGVRPERQVASIKQQELSKIHTNIKKVLKIAIKAKGSSVGDFVRTDGSWGQMGKFHHVYGRRGQKCKKCGTIIESIKLGGRTGSFCPKCQR
ncbi:MAG: bifunctional DNA-formamidopyrimidine glycosylase/DNA-(apurinic or apyrimidinic site) lyase [Candidatus Doudnabacteria bacterium]|jgi:formamidopyrimidine-DNA glycosylase